VTSLRAVAAGAQAQLDHVVHLIRGVLGDEVVGVWLYGSAVLGGLRPGSDLDVFVVTRRPTRPRERRALIDGLLPISGSRAIAGPARSIELTIVAQSDVRPWRFPPTLDFLYGDWLRTEFERGDIPAPRPNPDLAVLFSMVLRGGRPLLGPPPADVFDPVPRADLERASLDVIPGLLADLESDTGNVILTLARIWMTIATGEIGSKDHAADWVLARLPEEHRAVLARARAIYLGDEPERWDDVLAAVQPHAEYIVQEIQSLQSASDEEVRAALADFDRRFATGDADGLTELFAVDGQLLLLHRDAMVGRPAIREHWAQFFAEYDASSWRTDRLLVDVDGDRAYTLSVYSERLVPRAGGPKRDVHGRLILFLRRETGGAWQVTLAMNSHIRPVEEVP